SAGSLSGNVIVTGDGVPLNSPLLARLNPFRADTSAPQAGQRSFALERQGNDGPETVASAKVRITSGGSVLLGGVVNDRQKFSRSSALAGDGSAPFYVSLGHG